MFGALLSDTRHAARWLRRSPGFTIVAVVSLAIGIGFNTAIFSLVDAVMFRPLPVTAPAELADVFTSSSDGDQYATSSYPDFLDFRAENGVFSDMLAWSAMIASLNLGDRSRLLPGEVVSGNYFQMLGVGAALGRTLLPEDDRPGADRVVVVSHAYWQRELASDPQALGTTIRLRGLAFTIVGVAPRGFTGMLPILAPEIWLPLAHVGEVDPAGIQDVVPSPTGTNRLDRRGQRWLFVKGRLKPGVGVSAAQANLEVVMNRLLAAHPETNKDRAISVLPTASVRLHPAAGGMMAAASAGLMAVVGLGLLIACANVASMLLARASGRQREIAIRLAVGASRGRLVGQMVTESLVLALLGAATGTALAWWLTRSASRLDLALPVPLSFDLRIDVRVLAFTALVTLVAGLVAGLVPAIRASRPGIVSDLRGEAPIGRAGRRRWTLRDALVAGQVAVTVVLLVSAALLTRSLIAAERADVGFRTDGLAILSTDLDMLRYDETRSRRFFELALERVGALPGVESVALAARLPFSFNFNQTNFHIPGHQQPGDPAVIIKTTRVSADYFKTLGVPILEGRNFADTDTPDTPRVAIINETMARRYWPDESALGKRMHLREAGGPPVEIVGVVSDHRVMTVGETPQPYLHFAYTQQPSSYQVIVTRTSGDAASLLAAARKELLALEPQLAFMDNQTMKAQVEATLLPMRAGMWVVGAVGAVAMGLAAIGLYGAIAYSVARRRREMGIRLALGARPSSVVALVMRQGLTVAGAGAIVGSALAAVATPALGALLYGVDGADPIAWAAALATLAGTAAVANLIPARRAARVDPSSALRAE